MVAMVIGRLLRTGFRRGLMGGSRPWLMIGAVAALARLAQRASERGPDVVYRADLSPGQSLVVDVREPED